MADDFSQAVAAYHRASLAVLNDASVWREESASTERRLLAWPRPAEGTQFERLMSMLFDADVYTVLVLLRERDDPASPAWPPDARDPKMQVLLRVVQRSMQAGEAAMVGDFGGERITGKREFVNRTSEQLAELALRSRLPRNDAFEAVGLPRRQAFRAVKRTHRKK